MKSDSQQIYDLIDELSKESWLMGLRSKWVSNLFHFTEIDNAVEIIKCGKLLSRAALERNGTLPVDSACADIIANTALSVKECVRFYFRPLTPTQFNMEGFRPVSEVSRGSHCRIPIFFLFDSKVLLSKSGTFFSPGSLAINSNIHKVCSTAAELKEFPFSKIYSTGGFSPSVRDEIVSHRHAEVIVPDEVNLTDLTSIRCRSQAEKETLLYLLPAQLAIIWAKRIEVDTSLFKRNWVFIE